VVTRSALLLSGGLDSSIALGQLCTGVRDSNAGDVVAVLVDYGQRHARRELAAAHRVAYHYGVDTVELFLPALAGGALTGEQPLPVDVPADDPAQRATVVAGRNLLLLAAAAAVAQVRHARRVVIACHSGDHDIYPDTRPAFLAAADATIRASTDGDVALLAPFTLWPRTRVLRLGDSLHVPLALTWSCYDGRGERQCGRCGACTARRGVFADAELTDPTDYATDAAVPR
jgi:7-cyano-7-deazaguanine synthase